MVKVKCVWLKVNKMLSIGINFEKYHYFCILDWCVTALMNKYL